MSNSKATLNELNQLTMLTGRISEVHFKNMQAFPFIFFNGVASVEIDYSIATNPDDESMVTYKLSIGATENDFLEKRYKSLEQSIRTLFWKDVKVHVYVNGEDVYKSE